MISELKLQKIQDLKKMKGLILQSKTHSFSADKISIFLFVYEVRDQPENVDQLIKFVDKLLLNVQKWA